MSIQDTGGGIEPLQLERLLDWSSIKSSTSGFGLKLAKECVDKLGGQLRVESVSGKGTTFLISLVQQWESVAEPIDE
jgi:signal transduction histidine kinase